MTLEDFTRYVGAAIAIVGAFIVSPQGAAQFGGRMWAPIRKTEARLAKWMPFLRRSTTHQGSAAGARGIATLSARGRARPSWPERPTVKTLTTAVQDWLSHVDGELDELWSAFDRERSRAQKDVNDTRATLQQSLDDLQKRLQETEHQAAEHDSRALPVLGLGAMMGTVPGEIAALPLWLYIPLLTAAVVFTLDAVVSARRLRHGASVPGGAETPSTG